ncbi:hypothetical protein [Nocardia iowensis]|uniref:Uncharacterized protein n=1 Tax=Nocardia iowensis TaxID=204891 RepID=A0ABX8S0Y2_NOCIO|nr:hypothetical protein [Nocardia iowensis]QXN93466.1 hypothetical protein KV110_10485 [Nocardia iowensis]
MSDSVFWQMTTLAVPVASATAAMLFAFVVRLADAAYPSVDPSKHVIFAVVTVLMAAAATLLALRRTPRRLGAAVGTATAGFLVLFVWLATA